MGWVVRAVCGLKRVCAVLVRETGGNVAIIYALSLIPLLIAAGAAVDFSRALVVRSRLAEALDAAGLAVGASTNLNASQISTLAQQYFNANYPANKIGVPGSLNVVQTGQVITLSATANLPTTLMAVAGITHLDVSVSNEITRSNKALELALVLDTTGSMASSGKIQALQQSANDLIDILSGGINNPTQLKIGVVPFALSVRVNPNTFISNNWIDTNGTNATAQLNFSGSKYAYWLYTNAGGLSNTTWLGCLEARPNRLDETDTAPTGGNNSWVPWFQPDEPDIAETELARTGDILNANQTGLSSNFTSNYIVFPNETVWANSLTQSSGINTGSDTFTFSANHGLTTGLGPVTVTSTTTLPAPLVAGTPYWIIRTSNTAIKLATSAANAAAGTAVNVTSTGSGTLKFSGISPQTGTVFFLAYSATSGLPTVGKDVPSGTSTAGHGLVSGDGPFTFYPYAAGATVPTGLSSATDYWAIKVDNYTIKFASSRANALSNTPVSFTTAGSGSFAISESQAGTDSAHQLTRQKNWQKYVGKSFAGTTGPNQGCVMQPVQTLTNDMSVLKTMINGLVPNGSTNVPFGLGWGWRLISPSAPYTEGVAYSDPKTVKAIVLMTDGTNDMPSESSTLNGSGYATNGFAAQALMGNLNSGQTINTEAGMETGLYESETRLCNNIKAIKDANGQDRIVIYTIALMVNDPTTISVMTACASSPDKFFSSPTAGQLQTVFQTIARDLSNLRLSK